MKMRQESTNICPGYEEYDKNQMRRMTHLERFLQMGKTILFDYRNRNPLTKEAEVILIAKSQ